MPLSLWPKPEGYEPITELAKARTREHFGEGLIGPYKAEVQQHINDAPRMIEGIRQLLEKSKVDGWQKPYEALAGQLRNYAAWVENEILPHYEKRLDRIETIIQELNLVTLPERDARIRLASEAESAAIPAPPAAATAHRQHRRVRHVGAVAGTASAGPAGESRERGVHPGGPLAVILGLIHA